MWLLAETNQSRSRTALWGIFWRCRTIIGRATTLSAPSDPEVLFLSGNRELHLTPARFRSGGRLFFGDNARNQSDLFVSPQLAVCGLPASGTKMAMTPNAAEHAKWHAQPCLPGNNSTARQHFTSTDSIFIQYLTENRTHRLAAEISTDSHKRRPMRLGRSLLFSLPMAWLRKFSSG